jgi:hypothetical protein
MLEAVLPLTSATLGRQRIADRGFSNLIAGLRARNQGPVPIDIAGDTAKPRFRTVCLINATRREEHTVR